MQLPKTNLPIGQNGIVREAAVDEIISPETTVQFALNMNFDRIGASQLRKGVTLLGNQVAGGFPILGLANYRNNAGTTYRALAKVNENVYSFDGNNWTSVRGNLTSSSKARFTNFIDLTYMVNGNANQTISTFNGTTFGTTNIDSLPKGDLIENFKSRIWVADNSTDKVYYSDVVTTSNTITGGTEFIQVSPQDGEKITGLKRHPRALLVFKNNHIYRIFSISSTDPDPSITRGTYSQESILEGKDGIYYHHPSGFYKFVIDGEQKEISRPIIDIIKAIPRTYYENISGWVDDNAYYWSIGDITLDGVSFTNVVCRYTVSTEIWTLYSYGSEIRSAGIYDNGTTLTTILGDDVGNVLTFDSGTTDNGTTIFYDLITHWLYFTTTKTSEKIISELAALHENAQGATISYQVDSDTQNVWKPIGSINEDLVKIYNLNARFKRIRLRFSGSSVGSLLIFRGFELLNWFSEGELKK